MNQLIVSKSSIYRNIMEVEKEVGDIKMIGVVKGNGYGLDTVAFARTLLEGGVSSLACARLEDACLLRESGIDCEILLMTPVSSSEQASIAADNRLTCAVDSIPCALLLNTAAKDRDMRIDIHLKIDTGFGRFGFPLDCVNDVRQMMDGCEFLVITGIFSHLSDAFGKKEKHTKTQYEHFLSVVQKLQEAGIETGTRHLANSSAALRFPYTRLDGVRIGSAFTGRVPVRSGAKLERVGYLESTVAALRWLPKGANIGYANVYTTKRPVKIAIIPAGYGDGLFTEKSRDTYRFVDVLRYIRDDLLHLFKNRRLLCRIGQKKAPLLGRIGLTNCVADVTELDCAVGDTVQFQINPLLIDSTVPRVYR